MPFTVASWVALSARAVNHSLIYMDCIHVKVRDSGAVRVKALYPAIGVNLDGLKGFPDSIEAVFPKNAVQLCLVHMVRNRLNFLCLKQRTEVAGDMRLIYSASTED